MQIRAYAEADFEALYALEQECFVPPFRFSRRYMRAQAAARNARCLVAESEGAMLGFGIVSWSRHRGLIAAYLETLEVAHAARGKDMGRALLLALEAAAREAGAVCVGLHVDAANAAAIHLYESAGYQCQGRKERFYPEGRAALMYSRSLEEPLQ